LDIEGYADDYEISRNDLYFRKVNGKIDSSFDACAEACGPFGHGRNLEFKSRPIHRSTSCVLALSLNIGSDVILLATPSHSDVIKMKSLILEYGELKDVS
jgi:hypothetical protein